MATLRNKALLVKFSVTEFTNEISDPDLSRRVANLVQADDADSFDSKKKLLDCPAITKLKKLKGDTRNNLVNPLSAPFEVGRRIMPSALCDQLEHGYATAKQKWEDYKIELRGEIEGAINRAQRRLGDAWKASDYPSADDIVGKYTMSLTYSQIPDTEDFRIDNLSHDRNEEIRLDMERGINQQIEDAMSAIHKRAYDVISHLLSVCKNYGHDKDGKVIGRFKDSTVEHVRALEKLLPVLNMTGDPKLQKVAQTLSQELKNITPDWIKNSAGERQRIATVSESIIADLEGIHV